MTNRHIKIGHRNIDQVSEETVSRPVFTVKDTEILVDKPVFKEKEYDIEVDKPVFKVTESIEYLEKPTFMFIEKEQTVEINKPSFTIQERVEVIEKPIYIEKEVIKQQKVSLILLIFCILSVIISTCANPLVIDKSKEIFQWLINM